MNSLIYFLLLIPSNKRNSCYIYTIFRDMDENILSYIFTPNPLVLIRTKLRAVLRIKVYNNIYLILNIY